jgi:hypothetical protein
MSLTSNRSLLYDGLGYFVALTGTSLDTSLVLTQIHSYTATNLANILLYRGVGSDIQTSG